MLMSQSTLQETMTALVKFRSLVAAKVLDTLLDSPSAESVERILVWLGHKYPYRLPARGAIVGQLARRKAGKDLVATLIHNVKISVPSIPEGVSLYFAGCLMGEEKTTNLLNRVLRKGDIFFDIGAHFGFYTFMAASLCGPSGQIHAFEPQPALIEYLLRSVVLNGYEDRVTIQHAAVGEIHRGKATLFFAENKESTGIPSVFPHEWLDVKSGLAVPAVSIDGYLEDKGISRIDVIKMDIEGAEMLALHGMQATLNLSPPDLLILEISPPLVSFQSISAGVPLQASPDAAKPVEVVSFLREYGYEPREILKDGPIGRAYTLAELRSITWTMNVAFVSPNLKQNRPEVFAS